MSRAALPIAVLSMTLMLSATGAPVASASVPTLEVTCPAATLCLYPGQEFEGQPFLLKPPAAATGQCVAPGNVFSSAINNSRFPVYTYSQADCRIPSTPFAMCCSDSVEAGHRMKLNVRYRSVRWNAH